MQRAHAEVRADATAHGLGVPEIGGSGKRHDPGGAERGAGAHERPRVAGILDRIEHEETRAVGDGQRAQRAGRHVGHGEDTLRPVLGVGRGEKILLIDFEAFDFAALEFVEQRGAARRLSDGSGAQDAADHDGRAQQLLDGAHPFRDELRSSLPRLATLEIPR